MYLSLCFVCSPLVNGDDALGEVQEDDEARQKRELEGKNY